MTVVTATKGDLEQTVTYELLLTLLEHQFSSPVQWITTQNSMLDARHVRRYIEIGPSETILSMLRRTVEQNRGQTSSSLSVDDGIELLGFADEMESIDKEMEPEVNGKDGPEFHETDADATEALEISAPKELPPPSVPLVAVAPRRNVELDDAPATASEALLAIVASGLRMSQAKIDVAHSIKWLAKGRSALQNEIVGNLTAEFNQLPDGVEEMELAELGRELQSSFSGKLGRYLSEWLSSKVSAKFSPSVTVAKIRARLREAFGLKEGRQNSFFLTADFEEITSRLMDDQECWQVVHRWAESYVKTRGLEQMVGEAGHEQAEVLPSAAQEMTNSQMSKFGRDFADLMAKHFQAASTGFDSQRDIEQEAQREQHLLQTKIDQLGEELGPEFISGVKPKFRPELVYRYRSSPNWAVQDLYVTLSAVVSRVRAEHGKELETWLEAEARRLRRRSTERMRRCARYLLCKWEQTLEVEEAKFCVMLLRILLEDEPSVDSANTSIEGKFPEVSESWCRLKTSSMSSASETPEELSRLASPGASPKWPLRLCTQNQMGIWQTNDQLTDRLQETKDGPDAVDIAGTVLVIGAGKQSIGAVLVEQLLEAGCRVALCSSFLSRKTRQFYSKLYVRIAKPGAELVLLQFNQASVQDTNALVEYVNNTLAWEIDHLVPFAAIPEAGRTIEDLGPTSELAHRIMLTNTLRLMGTIVSSKRKRRVLNHSTQVLLPLSPNHGQFGYDGLYGESKLGLEALLNKWSSESWSDALCICGLQIGWTRGTGLMASNDPLAKEAERLGIQTFSSEEMASLIARVMSPDIFEASTLRPILCDFTGGFSTMPNLAQHLDVGRTALKNAAAVEDRLQNEAKRDEAVAAAQPNSDKKPRTAPSALRAGIRQDLPILPERYDDMVPRDITQLRGLLELDSLPVIAGFGEVGSAGSSRTRWELEAYGEFSIEGCIELAWMTGLIRYEREKGQSGANASPGWVRCETGEPISDSDVKAELEGHLRDHTGIRILDEDQWSNPNPRLRDMLHEVGTEEDLPPFECSPQAAEGLRARHGDAIEVLTSNAVSATVRVRRGASIFVPKALNTNYFVGAQVPTGWDAARYGIPAEVLAQADRPALYTLVCAVEAFLAAGLTDVYELYRYIHVSEVGNCIGSGAGGTSAIQVFHEQRMLGREVRSDILSETFIGTSAAWVNLLLLSASGPIKTGAGTCASSLESLDTACDLVTSGRAKFCLAGGYDVFTRPVFYEFGDMKALVDSASDEQCGREPDEMSRPFTTTRGGFVWSEGAGIQVVTSAALALEIGLPIYGIVAMTHMAADKIGRSVPAPGRGILTSASQNESSAACLLTDPVLRAKRIRTSLGHIERQIEADIDIANMEAESSADPSKERVPSAEVLNERIKAIRHAGQREKKAVQRELGHNFWRNNPHISPITGALSVFGLKIDDLTFASVHGTATRLNDLNEAATLDRQMGHLGRDPSNPLLIIAQKSVVGHGVGASGAWAINGALQAMHSGIIPGNRNADDVDQRIVDNEHLLVANENIVLRPEDIKAFSVTSFGFGQKGAQAIIVNPRYLYSAVSESEYQAYRVKQIARAKFASQELDRTLHGDGALKVKDVPPYLGDENEFLLDPLKRVE